MMKKKAAPMSSAPKVRIPDELLAEIDREAERWAAGTTISRTQMVAIALRQWLDARRAKARR